VEEQFYWIWPLVVLVTLRRFGRRTLGWVAGSLAVASAGLAAALYLAGASPDRLYYGTDTRAQSIMIGALLAVLVPLSGVRSSGTRAGPDRGRWLRVGGLAGAGVLAICLHAVQGNGPFLYEGGFLLVGLATAALIAVTVRLPLDPLSRALSWRPLRYTGRISYGLYLYHWPLFLVLNQARTGLHGTALLGLRFGATFLAAGLSARFIEVPIRTRRFPGDRSARQAQARARRWRPARLSPTLAGLAGLALVSVVAALAVTTTPGQSASASLAAAPASGYRAPGGASAARPERALVLGDSMALTLEEGLGVNASAWGIAIQNGAWLGCDLDPQTTVKVMGTVSRAAQGCPQWASTWSRLVAETDPDVVVVLLGRWESIDRIYGGGWTHVGDPAFDAHLQSELGQVIDIAASRGARVAFLTLPYIAQTTAQPDGSPWDMNLPARTDAYNADVRAAVARHPGQAAVVDLNGMLDPAGHYVSSIDGVRVRDYDDEHLSVAGGEWLRPKLLPALVALGSGHYETREQAGRSPGLATTSRSS
jgi:peptidoglycan/LPS O-acetylase OafA/YrhL